VLIEDFEMGHRFVNLIAVPIVLLAFSPKIFAQTSKQPESAKMRPATATKQDLSGVWMQYPGVLADGIDQKLRPPLTAWGQARFDAASPLIGPRAVAGKENSPVLHCVPDGLPKLLVYPNPFEVVQIPGRVLMFFEEQHIWRTIWTDGRRLPKNPEPTWMGYSIGSWDRDTFVVDSIGFNDRPWVDSYGNPRSEQMHLTERYRRVDHDTLELSIIMDDPKAYTKTWISPPQRFKLEPTWEIAESVCIINEVDAYDDAVRKPAGDTSPARGK